MRALLRSFTDFLDDLRRGAGLGSRAVQFTESAAGLTITSNLGDTLLDTRRRVVARRERVLTRFADVKSVRIREVRADDRPELWAVSLSTALRGSIDIALTTDDVEASILGARLSEVLGVSVVT